MVFGCGKEGIFENICNRKTSKVLETKTLEQCLHVFFCVLALNRITVAIHRSNDVNETLTAFFVCFGAASLFTYTAVTYSEIQSILHNSNATNRPNNPTL